MKPKLDNVTLMAIDGGNLEQFMYAVNICKELCDFEDIKLMTPFDTDIPGHIKIPPMDYEGYNRFLVKDMYKYCETSHMLLMQYDGFILNPKAWDPGFLQYDWIGARWWHHNSGIVVGNGGFSLRSRRIMEFASNNLNLPQYAPEDDVLLRQNGQLFLDNGFKIGTIEAASKFSQEFGNWNGQFGFHGKGTSIHNWIVDPKYDEYQAARDLFLASEIKSCIVH